MDNTSKTFTFRLVSPEAEIMSGPAVEASVPGTEGDMGVRAGHMPVISSLRPGVVTVQTEQTETPTRFFVAGGFVDINATSCTVLAETAVDVLTLNAGQVAADIEALSGRLAAANDDVTAATLRGELAIAQARLMAAKSA